MDDKYARLRARDGYLTVREVAEYLRCSPRFVRRELIAKGKLECKAENGDILMSELDAFVNRCRSGFVPVPVPQILATAARKRTSGIYFLLDHKRRVVYVGKSTNLFYRIGQHIKDNSKLFAYHAHIEIHEKALDDAERHYIAMLQPKFNISGNCLATRKLRNGSLPDEQNNEPSAITD